MKIRKNYNEKITTNLVDYNHLYLGFYVQSYANSDTIYKVTEDNSRGVFLVASHKIINNNYLTKIDEPVTTIDAVCGNWCETIYTDILNVVHVRNRKLKELGI
jgi:hypothetical protein